MKRNSKAQCLNINLRMKDRNNKEIKWKEGRIHHFFTRVMRGCFRRLTGEIVNGELFVCKDVEQHEQGIDDISE